MKVCYVFGASGEPHETMARYSAKCLKDQIPDAEVRFIGRECIERFYDGRGMEYVYHLGIPCDPQFAGYDRVVFLDADLMVCDPAFAQFAELPFDAEVWGCGNPCGARQEKDRYREITDNDSDIELNGGLICYALDHIDAADWERRLVRVGEYAKTHKMWNRDESFLYCMTRAAEADAIYNVRPEQRCRGRKPLAVHYRSLWRREYLGKINDFNKLNSTR